MDTPGSFGRWLRHRRRELDLTQDALARQVGCARITIRKIEEGQLRPSKELAALLMERLEVPPEDRESFVRFARGGPNPTSLTKQTPPNNIPNPISSFIGRERELTEIEKLVQDSRLVTITGTGGIGKTRFATQAAKDLLGSFKDGIWWVELATVRDPSLVMIAIAKVLGVKETPQQSLEETLIDFLHPKQLLIVLDNCEHLIEACAFTVEKLLTACMDLKILATSREPLGLTGEVVYRLLPLTFPDRDITSSVESLMQYEAIHLFVERAGAVNQHFSLTTQNASSVLQICRRLDGIPLALELAAARVKMMSASEIAKRITDRFDLLTTGSRTASLRQQTLRATIDWSHDLLTEQERILLHRLSVFAGGFTLAAAEAVCSQGMRRGDIPDLLGHLVDKSLVMAHEESDLGETRYRLLETIRQYALEELLESGEAMTIRDEHLNFYLKQAEEAESHLYGVESLSWFSRLDKELDNLRAAIEWSINTARADSALQILGSLVYFWFARGHYSSEWYVRIQQVLARPESRAHTPARAKALNGFGYLYWADLDAEFIHRQREFEEALSIGKELGDWRNIAMALRNLGLLEYTRENYAKARLFLEQSLEIWRNKGIEDKLEFANALIFLGDVALQCNDTERAHSLYQESLEVLKDSVDPNFQAYLLRRLGQLACLAGDYDKAITLCEESLRINQEVNNQRGVIACLAGFAAIAMAQGKLALAVRLMASVETQLAQIGVRLFQTDRKEYERNLKRLRAKLDEGNFANHWSEGRSMPLEQVIEYAVQVVG